MNEQYITTGDVARFGGFPLHKVTYAFQRLGIHEDARAGCYRLFLRGRLRELVEAVCSINAPDSEENPGRE